MANNSLVSKGSSKTGNGNGKNGHSTLYSLPTLYRGIYNRVAEKVGCDPSYVSRVARGERIGLIKFGSRVDVLVDGDAVLQVKVGDRVKGGASVVALLPVATAAEPILAGRREAC